jgi:hypothetical protein
MLLLLILYELSTVFLLSYLHISGDQVVRFGAVWGVECVLCYMWVKQKITRSVTLGADFLNFEHVVVVAKIVNQQ